MNEKTAELTERLRKPFSGPMTAAEIEFLRDAQAAIEFAIRNGLSFAMIASALGHDFNELARDLYDLQTAKARGFTPKVAGYGTLTTEEFGRSEDPPA